MEAILVVNRHVEMAVSLSRCHKGLVEKRKLFKKSILVARDVSERVSSPSPATVMTRNCHGQGDIEHHVITTKFLY